MKLDRVCVLALVGVVALTLAATGAWAQEAEGHVNTVAILAKAKIPLSEAISAALKQVPGGKATEVSFESTNGHMAYEVDVMSGKHVTEVYVDTSTGEVIKTNPETPSRGELREEKMDQRALARAKITSTDAIKTAESRWPGARAAGIEVSMRMGHPIYTVSLVRGGKLFRTRVDAVSGKLLDRKAWGDKREKGEKTEKAGI